MPNEKEKPPNMIFSASGIPANANIFKISGGILPYALWKYFKIASVDKLNASYETRETPNPVMILKNKSLSKGARDTSNTLNNAAMINLSDY